MDAFPNWQHLEIVAVIFLTGVVGKVKVEMCCFHQGQTHKGSRLWQDPRCHRDCLWIVSVDKELWVVDEHDEGSIGVEEEVDEVVPHRVGGRQVCKSEAHSVPVKEKAGSDLIGYSSTNV